MYSFQTAFGPRRQYKRKDAGPDDEKTRVRMTLLEYGNHGQFSSSVPPIPTPIGVKGPKTIPAKNESRPTAQVVAEDNMTASEVFVSVQIG